MSDLTPRLPEPRTWRPADVKTDPILVDDPTPAELGKAFNQLHRCVEAGKRSHDKRFRRLERATERLEGSVADIRDGLGLAADKPNTVATQTRRGAFWRTVCATALGVSGAMTAAGVAVRLGIVVWPSLKAGALAVLHAFAAGRL
jgi:hypothetical protein